MYSIVQAGNALQLIQTDGTVTTLTLPPGVTVLTTRRARIAVLRGAAVITNAPTVNLWLDPATLVLRPLSILPPYTYPLMSAGSGTGLTGAYRVKVSFAIKDEDGTVINESPLSQQSLSVTVSNKDLHLERIPVSANTFVNCRRLYRTAAGGTVFFPWLDIDDNVTTELFSNTPDAALEDLPEDPDLGNPVGSTPGEFLTNIVQWKNRLWACPETPELRDHLFFTAENRFSAWPADNDFEVPAVFSDAFGITGLMPRRDSLGVAKRDRIEKVVGSTDDDFEVVNVVEKIGCIAKESCVVIRDVAYFLGEDGVYVWDDGGVRCISRPDVDGWFTTDTYFNRAQFPNAQGGWNPVTNAYELGLAAVGSSNIDRWVSFHIDKQKWLGPHKTDAFTPTARGLLKNDNSALLPAIGASDAYVYLQNQTTPSDVAGTAVSIDSFFETKWHGGKEPDVEHFFGHLSVLSRIETGGTVTVTPYVGRMDAVAGTTLSVNLTQGRERLGILGVGAFCKLKFSLNTAARRFLMYGYEIDPFHEVGKR